MSNIRQLRAWDNQNKTWVYSGRTPSMMHGFWKWVMYDTSTIVNEETGLKDKNGKEIYEGDIVKAIAPDDHTDHNCISDVTRDTTDTSWCVRSRPDGDMEYEHGLNLLWWESLEVIGNIYENPELLT